MSRRLIFASVLCSSIEVAAQPEARIYYNPYEWIGVAGGYSVNRWRYEVTGSWHQEKVIGLATAGYSSGPGNMETVFEEDVWTIRTTTITARILRSGWTLRPWFKPYWGIHLRFAEEHHKLTEQNWGTSEQAYADQFGVLTDHFEDEFCLGVVLGARGRIVNRVFWDVNLSVWPTRYSVSREYYTSRPRESYANYSFSYILVDDYIDRLLQVGIGYKFATAKKE